MSHRPNVVFILADQHRADCLSAYGNSEVSTPAIDRLAAEGSRSDGCYCAYPVCTPSRYSLLSGLPVHRHGGWSNRSTLTPDHATFVSTLRDAGYRTTAVGKMHFTPTYLDVGFRKMLLCEQDGEGRWDDDYHRYLMAQGLADRIDLVDQRREYRQNAGEEYWRTFGAMASDLPEEHHSTSWIGRAAVDAVRGFSPDGGNLLMVGFVKPHHPFDPPANWLEQYEATDLSVPEGWTEIPLPGDFAWQEGYFPNAGLTEEALRRVVAHYYATISHMDYWVGRIVAALEQAGCYDDTLIVYTADHGEYLGFHHMLLKGGPLYEPLMRVPLVVKPNLGAEKVVSEVVGRALLSNADIGAAVLAACGHGSLPPERRHVCAHAPAQGAATASAMVRSRRYKLVRGPVESMFFDLALDPQELNNAITHPEYRRHVLELESVLADFEGGAPAEPVPVVEPDAPTVEPVHGNIPSRREVVDYFRSAMGTT